MKKLSLIIVIVLTAMCVQAQNSQIVKARTAIINLGLEYEYTLSKRTSVLGEVGFQLPIDVPQSVFDRIENLGTQNNLKFGSGNLRGAYLAGEYRFYLKGNAPQGFYVAPYAKLGNRKFKLDGSYSNNNLNIDSVSAAAELKLFTASLGGQIGYQFIIRDKFTINWNIIGFGLNLNRIKGSFTANDNGVFDDFAADAQRFIETIPGLKNVDLVPDNISKTISAGGGFPFWGVRTGLSIGYMF